MTRYNFRKYPIDIFKIVVEIIVEIISNIYFLYKIIDCRIIKPVLNNRTLKPLRLKNKINTRKFSFIDFLTLSTESEREAYNIENREKKKYSKFDTLYIL